jgi:EpsI family protein
VSIYVGVFDHPTADAKLVSAANRLVGSENPKWKQIDRGAAEVRRHNEVVPVRTGTLVGREGRILAWHWYWVDGTLTTSPARAALAQVLARVRGQSEMSAWVTAYTVEGDGPASGPAVLDAFLSDMLDSIDKALRAGNGGDGRTTPAPVSMGRSDVRGVEMDGWSRRWSGKSHEPVAPRQNLACSPFILPSGWM